MEIENRTPEEAPQTITLTEDSKVRLVDARNIQAVKAIHIGLIARYLIIIFGLTILVPIFLGYLIVYFTEPQNLTPKIAALKSIFEMVTGFVSTILQPLLLLMFGYFFGARQKR
ncbi:MAG: hypothetical protein ABFD69_10780 [Candidatus Sumerlaeia bacterium]